MGGMGNALRAGTAGTKKYAARGEMHALHDSAGGMQADHDQVDGRVWAQSEHNTLVLKLAYQLSMPRPVLDYGSNCSCRFDRKCQCVSERKRSRSSSHDLYHKWPCSGTG